MGKSPRRKTSQISSRAEKLTERSTQVRVLWIGCIAIGLATFVAYIPALHGGFVWDDDKYVTANPLLTAPDGLKQIWFSLNSPSQYFPLVYTVFRFEHTLWGLNPFGYHLVNVLLQIINALLLWVVLRRLSIRGAWLAAAIFALHPVNVESVAWVTELKNVLSTLFYLLTVLAWLAFTQRRSWIYYVLCVLFCALALFAKTTACTIPAVLLIVLWLRRERIGLARIAQVVPFAMMGLVMGLVSVWVEKHLAGTVGATFAFSPIQRILIAGHGFWFYLGKLMWPVKLCFSYPRWPIGVHNAAAYVWVAAFVLLMGALWSQRKRWSRDALIAATFFVVVLTPMLGLMSLYTFRYTFVADHYQYLACVGPIALLAAGVMSVKQAALRYGAAALILCALGGLTWNQGYVYRDPETLWRDTIAKNPSAFIAHSNLAAILNGRGEFAEAARESREAIRLQPDLTQAHDNLGMSLGRLGYLDEAIKEHSIAIRLDPSDKVAYMNLAAQLAQKGRVQEALVQCKKALSIDPNYAMARANLGGILLCLGRPEDAVREFRTALRLDPGSSGILCNLALSLIAIGRLDEATDDLRRVLKVQPESAVAHEILGRALYLRGDYPGAWQEAHLTESYGGPVPEWAADLSRKMPEP